MNLNLKVKIFMCISPDILSTHTEILRRVLNGIAFKYILCKYVITEQVNKLIIQTKVSKTDLLAFLSEI